MTTRVTATFVNGVLKPDAQLDLADQTRVNLTVELIDRRTESNVAWESIQERLRVRPIHAAGLRYSRDELNERR